MRRLGMNMEYPFGFEGFGDEGGTSDHHPSYQELQSYCERSLHSLEKIDEHEFMWVETHVSRCDSCLMVLINERLDLLDAESTS